MVGLAHNKLVDSIRKTQSRADGLEQEMLGLAKQIKIQETRFTQGKGNVDEMRRLRRELDARV